MDNQCLQLWVQENQENTVANHIVVMFIVWIIVTSIYTFKHVWVQGAGPDPAESLCNYVTCIINFLKYEKV